MRRILTGWMGLVLVLVLSLVLAPGRALPLPAAEPGGSLLELLPDGAVAAAEVNGLGARVK